MSLWRRVFTERRAVVLPLVLFLAANIGVLALVVLPLKQSVGRAEADAFAAIAGLGTARQLDTEARTAQARKAGADVELQRFYTEVLPRSLGEARNVLLFELYDIATTNGVEFDASTSDYDEVRESRLMKVSNTAVLRGQYQNVLRFLYALETAEAFVIIERVELAQSTVTAESTGGMLELLVDVATYYLPAPEAAAAGRPAAGETPGP